jgi:hypothetical protein
VLTNRPVFKCPVESFFQGNEKFLRGRPEESIHSVNSNQKWANEELYTRESIKCFVEEWLIWPSGISREYRRIIDREDKAMDRNTKVFSAAVAIGVCVGLAASVLATTEYRERAG